MRKFSFTAIQFILALILAAAVAIYSYMTSGISQEVTAELFLTVFIAASPLLFIFSRFCLSLSVKHQLKSSPTIINRRSVLADLDKLDTLVINKNITLVDGNFFVSALVPEGMTQSSLLSMAASAERTASHPYGRAIYDTAVLRGLRVMRHSAATEFDGLGVEALVARTPVRVGKLEWLQDESVEVSAALQTKADQLAHSGATPLFVSSSKYARGIIALKSDLREGIKTTLRELSQFGLKIVLFTGDPKKTANAIAKEFHISDVRSGLSNTEKARELQLLRSHGAFVAMVGDAVTDRRPLREADISIAYSTPEVSASDTAKNIDEPAENKSDKAAPKLLYEDDELARYLKEQAEQSQGTDTDFTPDIILGEGRLNELTSLLAKGLDSSIRLRQNRWLILLFHLLFLPLAAGLSTAIIGITLPLVVIFAALAIFAVIIAVNTFR